MPRSLSVSRETSISGNYRRLVLTVTEATGVDTNVFLYRQLPLEPSEIEPTGVFECVCSPSDMAEQPVDEPDDGAEPPWFRLDHVDLLLRSETELQEAWLAISEQLQTLLGTLETLDETTDPETFEFTGG